MACWCPGLLSRLYLQHLTRSDLLHCACVTIKSTKRGGHHLPQGGELNHWPLSTRLLSFRWSTTRHRGVAYSVRPRTKAKPAHFSAYSTAKLLYTFTASRKFLNSSRNMLQRTMPSYTLLHGVNCLDRSIMQLALCSNGMLVPSICIMLQHVAYSGVSDMLGGHNLEIHSVFDLAAMFSNLLSCRRTSSRRSCATWSS